MSESETPFENGMAAATEGKPRDVNPHPEDTVEHQQWEDGWEAGADGAWDAWMGDL